MNILALGINHDSAPVAIREKIAFAGDGLAKALDDLKARDAVREAAILSTCNRTELYCHVAESQLHAPAAWLHGYHELPSNHLTPYLYQHDNEAAVRHVLRVATGLDSMIVGEPEILGQMKSAWRTAQTINALDRPLDKLFQHAFSTAKKIRSQTAIGRKPVSVASTAITMARRLAGDFSKQTVLLIGAGETMELTARHLCSQNVRHLLVANRTLKRAQELANRVCGSAIPLSEIDNHLIKADIIFTSTASEHTILSAAQLARATQLRKRRPIFVIDLAVPRDIDPTAADLPDVYLYTLDDIQKLAEQGMASRRAAAAEAEGLIDHEVDIYMRWLASLNAQGAIQQLRQVGAVYQSEELEQARRALRAGKSPDEVLTHFAHKLTQRFLHEPSVRLRKASSEGHEDLLSAAVQLFGISDMVQEREQSSSDEVGASADLPAASLDDDAKLDT